MLLCSFLARLALLLALAALFSSVPRATLLNQLEEGLDWRTAFLRRLVTANHKRLKQGKKLLEMFVIGIYFVCTATQFSFNGEAMLQIFASMVVLSKVLAQVAATVALLHLNDSEQVATDLG